MSIGEEVTVIDLFRALPVRSALYTAGPIVIAIVQFANSYYHGLSLVYPAVFGVVMATVSVLITQYHMMELRTARLRKQWLP